MKVLINESQFVSILSESESHTGELCSHYGVNTIFCKRVATFIKNNRGNARKQSKDFFKDVLQNSGKFRTIDLNPQNEEYKKRVIELEKFRNLLVANNSCPNIVDMLDDELKNLPNKGLKMNVGENDEYDILNRLDTHYTALAYLLTRMILDSLDEVGLEEQNLSTLDDKKIVELITYVLKPENVEEVATNMKRLLDNNEHFRNDLLGTIKYSKERGTKVENTIFDSLRKKYGSENVYIFTDNYGFVDNFGVDGVVVFDGMAHPVQISTTPKTPEPKIFKYTSQSCKPIGYFKGKDTETITYYRL